MTPDPYVLTYTDEVQSVAMERVCRECGGNGTRCEFDGRLSHICRPCATCSGSGLELTAEGARLVAFFHRHGGVR